MKFSGRLASILLVCLMVFSMFTCSVSAVTYSDGYLRYSVDNSNTYAVVIGYEEDAQMGNPITDLVIPATFYNKPVVGIAKNAFVNLDTITSLSFESGSIATYIKESAFSFCPSLKTVTLPSTINSIGNDAFLGCFALETVNIQGSSIAVGDNAFSECSSLTTFNTSKVTSYGESSFFFTGLEKVVINKAVTYVPDFCFGYCDNLNTAIVSGKSTVIADTAFYREEGTMTMVTAADGSLAADFAANNGYANFMLGDVDMNGSVKIRDVTYIQMYAAKAITLSDAALLAGDVNFDGKVNVRDVTLIQSYLGKMITEF